MSDADARNLLNVGLRMMENDANEAYRNKQLGIQQEQLQMQRQKNAREKAIYDFNQSEIAGVESINQQIDMAEANGEEYRPTPGTNTRQYGKAITQRATTKANELEIQKMNMAIMQSANTRAKMQAMPEINQASQMAYDQGDWKGAAMKMADAYDDFTPNKIEIEEQADGSVLVDHLDIDGTKQQPERFETYKDAYLGLNDQMVKNVGINSNGTFNEKIFAQFNAKNIAAAKMYNRKQMEGDTKYLASWRGDKDPIPYRVMINPINMSRDLVSVETGEVLNKAELAKMGYGTPTEINALLMPEKQKSEVQKIKEAAQGAKNYASLDAKLTENIIEQYNEKYDTGTKGEKIMGIKSPPPAPQTKEQIAFWDSLVDKKNMALKGAKFMMNGGVDMPNLKEEEETFEPDLDKLNSIVAEYKKLAGKDGSKAADAKNKIKEKYPKYFEYMMRDQGK